MRVAIQLPISPIFVPVVREDGAPSERADLDHAGCVDWRVKWLVDLGRVARCDKPSVLTCTCAREDRHRATEIAGVWVCVRF